MIIQSIWLGTKLSNMQKLCISSYLQNGHSFHLYTYNPIEGIPVGTTILPGKSIISFDPKYPDCASFADNFRYNLLLAKGGWYVDMDTVCVKPFDLLEDYVFAQEHDVDSAKFRVNNNVIKAPRNTPIMQYLSAKCAAADKGMIGWGELGPCAITEAVNKFGFKQFVKDTTAFNLIQSWDVQRFLTTKDPVVIPESTYAVHLWNEMWRREGYDPDGTYPVDCLYEQLKRRYGI